MFVHFGLYSSFGGRYARKEISGFGEWIQRRAQIPISVYEAFGKENFRPTPDFAKNLVREAKAAGVRYIVMTSKHHDGFGLFKSDADSYNTYEFFGRDLCRELADACHEAGLELGFYYSHALDWHERNGGGNHTLSHPNEKILNRNFWDYPDDNIDFAEYFRRKCLPQVRELLTNYGDLKCIWFDYPHDITYEQSFELRNLVKEIQPNCLINSRIGYNLCDYYSLGDNYLPYAPACVPTECLITLNDSWGYKMDDLNYKSSEQVADILCRAISSDATLLMNVGPMGDGSLTPETLKILSDISEWTKRNSEAIYGNISANPFKSVFTWGYVSRGEKSLYLYVKDCEDTLSLSGINSTPLSVSLIGDSRRVEYSFENGVLTVKIVEIDMFFPIYRVDFAVSPSISSELEIDSARGSLLAAYATVGSRADSSKCASIPHKYNIESGELGISEISVNRIDAVNRWESSDDVLTWDVSFLESGEYSAEIVAAEPSFETTCSSPSDDAPCTLSVGDASNSGLNGVKPTARLAKKGRSVRDGGRFRIEKAGKYRVALAKDNDALGLGVLEVRFTKEKKL